MCRWYICILEGLKSKANSFILVFFPICETKPKMECNIMQIFCVSKSKQIFLTLYKMRWAKNCDPDHSYQKYDLQKIYLSYKHIGKIEFMV